MTRRPFGGTAAAGPGLVPALVLALVLAFSAHEAGAAALGSLKTSVGLLAALAALLMIKAGPAHLQASTWSTAVAALAIASGAVWWWYARTTRGMAARLSGLTARAGSADAPRASGASRLGRPKLVVLPPGFDREQLLADLRRHFVALQQAWDSDEPGALDALTTPEMLAELRLEQCGCTAHGAASNATEVVTLRAELLDFEVLAQACVVSVEFSGLMRDGAANVAVPFRELWLLTQSTPPAGGGWRLARHQALL